VGWEHLTDERWEKIKPYLSARRLSQRGRPPVDDRMGFDAIPWMLWTGGP